MNHEIEKIDHFLNSAFFRRILPILVVVLYLAGLLFFFTGRLGQGLSLWFLSTVIGGIQLLTKRKLEEKKAGITQMIKEMQARNENANQEEVSDANAP